MFGFKKKYKLNFYPKDNLGKIRLIAILSLVIVILAISGFFILWITDSTKQHQIIEDDIVRDSKFYVPTDTPGWHRILLGSFSIATPDSFLYKKVQGVDSYVGEITDGKTKIQFDYGWYTDNLLYLDPEKYFFSDDTLNGFKTEIIRPRKIENGLFGLYIDSVNNENRFGMIATNSSDEKLILNIFKSVRIKGGDYSNFSKNFGFNLTPTKFRNPLIIFNNYCSSCHTYNSTLIGASIDSMASTYSNEWLLNWISNSMLLIDKKDSIALKIHTTSDIKWNHNYDTLLTKIELKLLTDWIKSNPSITY